MKNNWDESEIQFVIEEFEKYIFESKGNQKFLSEIKREELSKIYLKNKNDVNLVNHSEDSFISLIYNILSILTDEQYGLSGYSKKLKNLVQNSTLVFSKPSEYFYIDSEIYDDIDSSKIEEVLDEENKIVKGEKYTDFHERRIIPIYLSIDIDTFLKGFEKKFNLDVKFQREFVWSLKKQQNLIESIFLSIPIPEIYSYELENQTLEIVDGKQRLNTIYNFYKDKFSLPSDFKINDMKNKLYSNLSDVQKNWFLNFSLMFMKIPYKKDGAEIKYEIFDKLNSNSTVLNFQELRNSVFRSRLNDEVKKMAKENQLINKFLPFEKSKRMQNIEMIYRFLSLKDKLEIKGTNEIKLMKHVGLRKTIDDYMKKWSHENNDEKIHSEIKNYLLILEFAYQIFGNDSFKGYDENKNIKKVINRPLMDATMLSLHLFLLNEEKHKKELISKKELIKKEVKELFCQEENRLFSDSFLSATGNSHSIEIKLNALYKVFQNVIGR